ncbi:hypothetical protein Rhopal_000052-T1 [Rhodotorula paludigena]|uniref:Uncharacterized protein n=1 Tax=Rhodotorula paludigena TaxID=86838 RepID=A0AAV5GCR3_9BASI|nr:hypothetical protein Rhopal_000052-T1 [Rhodotorula paludigena]
MTFGEAHSERYGVCNKETSFAILDEFYKAGGNFLDTANVYRDGESETWIGEWMAARNNRDQMIVATKYTNSYRPQFTDEIQSNYRGNGVKSMRTSIESSLKRLQTDYIDLFYLHIYDATVSIPELMHGLDDLVRAGKVLYLGISDTPAWFVTKANQYARDHGLRQFSVYQGMWSAAMRDFEREIIPMALSEGMALAPYGALNQGRFQTKEGFKAREKDNSEGRNFIPTSERDKQVSAVLEELADARGDGTTLLNIALAYVLQKTPYVFPIIGGRKVEHLTSNISALEVELTDDELHRIERAYEFEHGFPTSFLSGSLFDPKLESTMVTGPQDIKLVNGPANMDWAPTLPARPDDPASPPSAAPVSPEDLARQLADFRVGLQQPSAPAEPEEEEWALKSIVWPPLPPTPHAAADGEGRVQGFETDDRLRVRIICQNQNGPCSLIALCNILILRNDLDIAPGRTSVTYSHLSNLLADYFLRMTTSAPASSPSAAGTAHPTTPSTELWLSAALSILPQTRCGLNLDPRFDRIDGFTSSSSGAGAGELALFSLARIPLLHGWLADPSDADTYAALVGAVGCGSYDRAVECVVEGCEIAGGADRLVLREEECTEEELLMEVERRSRWSEDEQKKVRRAYLIQSFLSSTATQLSYPGLSALCTTPSLLPPSGLAALFRNSHLSVLYRRPTVPSSALSASQLAQEGPELFTLVTDSAFAAEEDIVWESLEDVDGADAALARQLQAEEDAYSRALLDREQRDADLSQPRRSFRGAEHTIPHPAQAGTPPRRDGGRREGEREGGRMRKRRMSGATEAKSGGKPDKDKCVVM